MESVLSSLLRLHGDKASREARLVAEIAGYSPKHAAEVGARLVRAHSCGEFPRGLLGAASAAAKLAR